MQGQLVFRQLFDAETSTFTYLLGDLATHAAALIDPVIEKVDRDVALLRELGFDLKYALNTHVHADHISGSGVLKLEHFAAAQSVLGPGNEVAKSDIKLKDGERLSVGPNLVIEAIHTPGHTLGCTTYYVREMGLLFTGDALLIRGCGRTDFQNGSADMLYDSIHKKLFVLPDETAVYPCHDYRGFTSSTLGEEKRLNPRLAKKTKSEFQDIMKNLNLPYPKKIDACIPANLLCGLHEVVPDEKAISSAAAM